MSTIPQSGTIAVISIANRALRRRVRKWRRHLYESLGSDRYSRPSLNQIDRQLEKYLPYRSGFFIEVGANDGFAQSNTYYLERFCGWHGILIEPIPRLYRACVRERPKSYVFNCALVAAGDQRRCVTMLDSGLMSLVEGSRGSRAADLAHIERGKQVQGLRVCPEVTVPVRTLTSILDEVQVQKIDLFSLDVEGYELAVLKGLDLRRYRPTYMLIETSVRDQVQTYLADEYDIIDELSHHDILCRRKEKRDADRVGVASPPAPDDSVAAEENP
jgi:FkbM family methyltransferase